MPRVWRTPSHLNLTKVKSLHPVLEFTFQSSMQTSTCRASWRAFSAERSGWRPDSVELAGNPEAEPRERLLEQTARSAEHLGRLLEARAPGYRIAAGTRPLQKRVLTKRPGTSF